MSDWNDDKNSPEIKRAFLFQEHLALLDTKRTEAYMNDDVLEWVKVCDRIFTNISFKLSKEEFKEADEQLQIIKKKVRLEDDSSVDLIHSFELLLMKLQYKYRLIYPQTETKITGILRNSNKLFDKKNTSEEVFEE